MWAKNYANMSGAMSRDNALEHQWPGSGSHDYEGLNKYNFLNTYLNESIKMAISIYVKRKWQ